MKINFYNYSSELDNSIDNFLFTGFFKNLKKGDFITTSKSRYETKDVRDSDAFVIDGPI